MTRKQHPPPGSTLTTVGIGERAVLARSASCARRSDPVGAVSIAIPARGALSAGSPFPSWSGERQGTHRGDGCCRRAAHG